MNTEVAPDRKTTTGSVGVVYRLAIVIPCILAVVLIHRQDHANSEIYRIWNTQEKVTEWISVLSGPLASWIEFSGETSPKDKAISLVAAPLVLLGILSHPIKPGIGTALATAACTFLWYFWGLAITCMGV